MIFGADFLVNNKKKQEKLQPSTVVVANALSHYTHTYTHTHTYIYIYIYIHAFTIFSPAGLHKSSFFHSSHFREIATNGISYRLKFFYFILFRP
jgi:hypothetical protein